MTTDKIETQRHEKKETEISRLKEELSKKEKELTGYINHIKRTQADFENYKKRIEKEHADASKREIERLIKELLPIIDNLERALDATKKNHDLESLANGVEMTRKSLACILQKEGLEKIDSKGRQFDPHLHEAVMAAASEECEDNTVLEELEKGYTFRDRVLRPSKVKVAKNE